MDKILVILLVVAAVKFVIFGILLGGIFKNDIRQWLKRKKIEAASPPCTYCGSVYTHPLGEGETRWEDDDLILVTTYECEHCRFPFWHVERIPIAAAKR